MRNIIECHRLKQGLIETPKGRLAHFQKLISPLFSNVLFEWVMNMHLERRKKEHTFFITLGDFRR